MHPSFGVLGIGVWVHTPILVSLLSFAFLFFALQLYQQASSTHFSLACVHTSERSGQYFLGCIYMGVVCSRSADVEISVYMAGFLTWVEGFAQTRL
jgi:hypothetical protein